MAEETTPVLLPGGLPELPEEGVGTAQALAQLQAYQRELEARNEQVGIDEFLSGDSDIWKDTRQTSSSSAVPASRAIRAWSPFATISCTMPAAIVNAYRLSRPCHAVLTAIVWCHDVF
jgi:hypothetical protein